MNTLKSVALGTATTLIAGCVAPENHESWPASRVESGATARTMKACDECRDESLDLSRDIDALLRRILRAAKCTDNLQKDTDNGRCPADPEATISAANAEKCAQLSLDDEQVKCVIDGEETKDSLAVDEDAIEGVDVCAGSEKDVQAFVSNQCIPEIKANKTVLSRLRAFKVRLDDLYRKAFTAAKEQKAPEKATEGRIVFWPGTEIYEEKGEIKIFAAQSERLEKDLGTEEGTLLSVDDTPTKGRNKQSVERQLEGPEGSNVKLEIAKKNGTIIIVLLARSSKQVKE